MPYHYVIGVVGAGALGSHLVQFGRNWKPPFFAKDETDRLLIKVIDFDRVEAKNMLGQFHGKQGKGRNKAQALAQSIQGQFGVKIATTPYKLTSDNIDNVMSECFLIVDCTDNIKARRLIQSYAEQANKHCIHGALSADGTFGQVIWTEDFTPDPEAAGQATCEDGEGLPFHSLVASRLALVVQRFLTDGTKQSFQISHAGTTLVKSVKCQVTMLVKSVSW